MLERAIYLLLEGGLVWAAMMFFLWMIEEHEHGS